MPVDILTYGARTQLYAEGDAAAYVFAVKSGMLKLTQSGGNGTARIVRFLGAGQVAGFEALAGGPYRHSVESVLPTLVCRIPVDPLQQGVTNDPALTPQLFHLWLRTLDDAEKVITQLSTGGAQGRIARLLLNILSEAGDDNCVSLSREDMAALLSVTIETVSRIIAEFKRQGILLEAKGRMQFDREALAPLARQ